MFEYQTTGTFIRFVGCLSVYVAAVSGVSESCWMGELVDGQSLGFIGE